MEILLIISGIIGYFVGVKATLMIQLVAFVGLLWFTHGSAWARSLEIGVLLFMGMFWVGVGGMILGDVVYAFAHPDLLGGNPISHFFGWLFSV